MPIHPTVYKPYLITQIWKRAELHVRKGSLRYLQASLLLHFSSDANQTDSNFAISDGWVTATVEFLEIISLED